MLQQTQAARVAPAYLAFVREFPTVHALARAPRARVIAAWSGLGYNRRAVSLHEAARRIVAEHRGRVPSDPTVLATLPGVGPYTSAAVASIAFGVPVPAIDVNLHRVVARARLGRDARDAGPAEVRAAAMRWIDRSDPGTWNEALMDVGRTHCRAVPRCDGCPLARGCAFRRAGSPVARRAGPRADPFAGSSREARGAVVRTLRDRGSTVGGVARVTGIPLSRVAAAVRGLVADGLVSAGPAALRGEPSGRIRLPGPAGPGNRTPPTPRRRG